MEDINFNRGTIKPIECLKQGWALIKDQYWLFLGIVIVGLIISSLAPLGILLGPMMCGIYFALLKKMRGETVSFEMLFKGFDYFKAGAITSIIQVAPVMVLYLIFYLPLVIFRITKLMAEMKSLEGRRGEPPDLSDMFATVGLEYAVIGGITIIAYILAIFFFFCYPLIAERNLTAKEAIKTSYRAGLGNIGGVICLLLLQFLLSIVGVLACYVGAILLIPIIYASNLVAYKQVFPDSQGSFTNEPPMPPKEW